MLQQQAVLIARSSRRPQSSGRAQHACTHACTHACHSLHHTTLPRTLDARRRIRGLADGEPDVDAKMRLRRLFRSLQGVDEEVGRYNSVLTKFQTAKDEEWEAVVAVYRGDLQKPFFEHMQVRGMRVCALCRCARWRALQAAALRSRTHPPMHNSTLPHDRRAAAGPQCLVAAAKDDAPRKEQLVLVNTRLLALVAAHDSVAADTEKLEAAAEVYRDLLSSVRALVALLSCVLIRFEHVHCCVGCWQASQRTLQAAA